MILAGSVYFYLGFIRKFLNTGKREPFLKRCFVMLAHYIITLSSCFSYIYFFTDKYIILNILENNVIKLLFFIVISIIVITYSFKKERSVTELPCRRKYCTGLFFDDLFADDHYILEPLFRSQFIYIEHSSMFYYETGIDFRIVIVSVWRLAYKNKKRHHHVR